MEMKRFALPNYARRKKRNNIIKIKNNKIININFTFEIINF